MGGAVVAAGSLLPVSCVVGPRLGPLPWWSAGVMERSGSGAAGEEQEVGFKFVSHFYRWLRHACAEAPQLKQQR